MGNQPFNPIGFLKILTKSERRKWKMEAQKREALLRHQEMLRVGQKRWAKREKALREILELSQSIANVRSLDENPNRKALSRIPKGPTSGFKRPRKPSPTGKGVGAYRVDRSKIRRYE